MKALVIFDSNFGNTRLIANTIAKELGEGTQIVTGRDFKKSDLVGKDLLVVGSPIIAWKPTEKIATLLSSLQLKKDLVTAAFDTRVKSFVSGNGAKKIAKALENAGGKLIVPPEGFYVKGKEGPLFDGEIERAKIWAHAIKLKSAG